MVCADDTTGILSGSRVDLEALTLVPGVVRARIGSFNDDPLDGGTGGPWAFREDARAGMTGAERELLREVIDEVEEDDADRLWREDDRRRDEELEFAVHQYSWLIRHFMLDRNMQ